MVDEGGGDPPLCVRRVTAGSGDRLTGRRMERLLRRKRRTGKEESAPNAVPSRWLADDSSRGLEVEPHAEHRATSHWGSRRLTRHAFEVELSGGAFRGFNLGHVADDRARLVTQPADGSSGRPGMNCTSSADRSYSWPATSPRPKLRIQVPPPVRIQSCQLACLIRLPWEF